MLLLDNVPFTNRVILKNMYGQWNLLVCLQEE
jgi:hypothetical protein